MKPNFFIVVVDSLRYDKCYGPNTKSIIPNLKNLIENGVFSDQTISSAPTTIPATSSLLTGKYAYEAITRDEKMYNFNKQNMSFIEEFANDGYNVHAFLPDVLAHTNIPQLFGSNCKFFDSFSTLSDSIGEQILGKLSILKTPWIFYVHLMDLHGDAKFHLCDPPKEFFDTKFGSNKYERMLSLMDVWFGRFLEKIQKENTIVVITADHGSESASFTEETDLFNERTNQLKNYEPGTVFKIAHRIAVNFPPWLNPIRKTISSKYVKRRDKIINERLRPELKKTEEKSKRPFDKRIMQKSINITTQIYDEKFRVPLILSGCDLPSSKIITQQIRTIDIAPTLLDLTGIASSNKTGKSIMPLIRGDSFDELPAFIDSCEKNIDAVNDVIGIRTSRYKYFRHRTDEKKNVHLFDLQNDPLEENNISQNNPQLIQKMEHELSKITTDKKFTHKTSQDFTDDEIKKAKDILLKLGYI